MAKERIYKTKPKARKQEDSEIESIKTPVPDTEKLVHDMDDILDEIDSVLEENAEEFIKSYVQKGGQ